MVVHDFDVIGVATIPAKTNAPPIIDTDAELAFSTALERLQAIARRYPQVVQVPGAMQILHSAPGNAFDTDETGYRLVFK